MGRSAVINLALFAFIALVLVVAASAARRTHHAADFLVASRRLGAALAAGGYVGSATNAWMLLLMSGAAFTFGLSAVWLWGSFVFSALVSWFYIAPRLRTLSAAHNAHTSTQLIGADAGDRLQPWITRSAAVIALLFLGLLVAVLVRAAAGLLYLDSQFDIAKVVTLTIVLICACVLVGGLRAASICDSLQAMLMAGVSILLTVPAVFALGNWDLLLASTTVEPALTDWFAGKRGVVALAVASGAFALGFAVAGQPHAMARFIAVKDEVALRRARWLALAWTTLTLAAVMLCGWCARLLYDGLDNPENALYALATRLLPPWLGALFVSGLFAALVLSLASPMLALASQLAIDLRRATSPLSISLTRGLLVFIGLLAIFLATLMPLTVLEHGVLAFTALGASFGPLLLVRLSGKRLRPGSILGAMWAGCILTLLFHLLPDSPGDFLERVLPFVAALGIALTGGERRRNPDRADRAQETVHDRIPI